MMLRRWLGATLLLGFGLGCSRAPDAVGDSDTEVTDTDRDSAPRGDPALGRPVFEATCANGGCHGADGVVGPAPDLTEVVPFYSDDRLGRIVLGGAGRMPGQDVSEDDLDDLIAFLRMRFPE